MKDIRIFPNGCLMRFVIINERGEIMPRHIEFGARHPSQSKRVAAIESCVKYPDIAELPLHIRNLRCNFGVN